MIICSVWVVAYDGLGLLYCLFCLWGVMVGLLGVVLCLVCDLVLTWFWLLGWGVWAVAWFDFGCEVWFTRAYCLWLLTAVAVMSAG